MTKPCICCNRELPLSEFHRHPTMREGRINTCRDCVGLYQRAQRKIRQSTPQWRIKDYERRREAYKRDKAPVAQTRELARRIARDNYRRDIQSGVIPKAPCSRCKRQLSVSGYYRGKTMRDGYFRECKACCIARSGASRAIRYLSPAWTESERERNRNRYHRSKINKGNLVNEK